MRRSALALLALGGCELVLPDRLPPRTSGVVARTERLPVHCWSAPPLMDLAALPDGRLAGVAHLQGLQSDDGGRTWTKTFGVTDNGQGDVGLGSPVLTAGRTVVLDDGAWLFVRRGEVHRSADEGGTWIEQVVDDTGGGWQVPHGAATRAVDLPGEAALAFRRGLWWLTRDGGGSWEVVFVDSFFEEGSSVLAQPRDVLDDDVLMIWEEIRSQANLWLIRDGGEPIPLQPADGVPLSPTGTFLLDDHRVVSIGSEMRVFDVDTGLGRGVPIAGGAYSPSTTKRLDGNRFLAAGTHPERGVVWVLLEPDAGRVTEVRPDLGRDDVQVAMTGVVEHGDGTFSLTADVATPVDGVRGYVTCEAGAGVQPALDTLIEGVPHDLQPGEIVVHALVQETVQAQTGGMLIGPAYQPTWIHGGLVYGGGEGAPPLPVNVDAIDHGLGGVIARGLAWRGGATGVVYSFSEGSGGSLQSTWDRWGEGEAQAASARIVTEERRLGARAQYTTANGGWASFVGEPDAGRQRVVGMGVDGLFTTGIDDQRAGAPDRLDTFFPVDGLSGFLPGHGPLRTDRCEAEVPPEDCLLLQAVDLEDVEADLHGNVFALDRARGVVWMHEAGTEGDVWEPVAEGFVYPVDLQIRELDGRPLVFVRDSVIFAFVAEPGTVARWAP